MTTTRKLHTPQTSKRSAGRSASPSPPPLEPGDRLTRAEFERRWEAMPRLKNAELINGEVYMAAALRIDRHGRQHGWLITWLGYYASLTPGVDLADNPSDRLDEDNMPQPDALLRIPESAGGQSRVSEDGYLEGAPELVAEIASSSASYDLHDKKDVYRRHGVKEYIVWRVLDEQIDWFVLRDGRYEILDPDENGVHRSEVFPGLWLDGAALLRGDLKRVFETVDRGGETEDHAAFIERLRAAK